MQRADLNIHKNISTFHHTQSSLPRGHARFNYTGIGSMGAPGAGAPMKLLS